MAKTMTLLERAIEIALEAHAGQKGKDGGPCILHPLRLIERLKKYHRAWQILRPGADEV